MTGRLAFQVFFTIAYALVFAEFFTRVFSPQPMMPRFVTGSSYGVRANIAGSTYEQKTEEVSVEVRINSQGFRSDKIYTPYPEEGVCRIAIFGDSFFMGYETEIENSFAGQLENILASRGVASEVVNFAVSGFGTAENLVVLKERGLSFNPDVIIFEWQETDFGDNVRSGLYRLQDGAPVRAAATYLPAIEVRDSLMKFGLYRWLISNSHFYSAIREATAGMVKDLLLLRASSDEGNKSRPGAVNEKRESGRLPYRDELSVALLKESYELSGERNIVFAVVDVPRRISRVRFVSSIDKIEGLLPADLTVVKPLEAFLGNASPDTKIYYEKGAGHLTPLGNSLLADRVAGIFENGHFVEKCRAKSLSD